MKKRMLCVVCCLLMLMGAAACSSAKPEEPAGIMNPTKELLLELGKLNPHPGDANRVKQTDLRRISSVPDVWSQHQLFHMMLTNTDTDDSYTEYKEIILREWRAMFAVLLLGDSYDVKIHKETIDFKEEATNPYISAAYKVRPKASEWNGMDIYYVEDQEDGNKRYPIAMSSPTVHIVPTKDAWETLNRLYPGKIPWLKYGKVHAIVNDLKKPGAVAGEDQAITYTPGKIKIGNGKETPAILQIHALVLKQWLELYKEKTANNKLLVGDLVKDYAEALKTAYNLGASNIPNIVDFVNGYANAEIQIHEVSVPKRIKLFSDSVYYADIEYGTSYQILTDAHKNAGGLGDECVTSIGDKNYVQYFIPMPVTDIFWALWNENADLKPQYKIDITPSGELFELSKIAVSIAIGDIKFLHEYKADEGQVNKIKWYNLCISGIWPRQRIKHWSRYFMFCVGNNGYALVPDDTDGMNEKLEYKLYAPNEETGEPGNDEKENKQETKETCLFYYMLNRMPNRCKLFHDGKLLGYVTTRKSSMTGSARTFLPDEEKRIYKASLDFGTSSTTMFGTSESEGALISGLNFWSLPLINPQNDEGGDTPYFAKYFVPALPLTPKQISKDFGNVLPTYQAIALSEELQKDITPGFPLQSILADAIDSNIARQPLFHSWIFYRAFMGKRENTSWPKLYSNLKWNQDGGNKQKRVEAFLMQALYMIALEARCNDCNTLSLTASYPITFSKATTESYFQSLGKALEKVTSNTGLNIDGEQNVNANEDANLGMKAITRITESEAAFRHACGSDSIGVTYCVIDIGGGSADLFVSAVKDSGKHYYSSSIRFGARKILLEGLLSNKARLLTILFNNAEDSIKDMYVDPRGYFEKLLKSTRENDKGGVEDLLGMVIPVNKNHDTQVHNEKTFGDAYAAYCAGISAESDDGKLLLKLKKRIALYLATIIYCSGLMVREEQGIHKDSATILLAGNGSKVIHWLNGDIEIKTKFVKRIFQAGMQTDIAQKDFKCQFSKKPKLEVASGSLKEAVQIFGEIKQSDISQVRFGKATEEPLGDEEDQEMVVQAGLDELKDLLTVYKTTCKECFGWSFAKDEYSAEIFDATGRARYVDELLKARTSSGGVFLIEAVDVISSYYLDKN